LFILSACSNAKYDEAMEKAQIAIQKQAYTEAIPYYEIAIKEKANDEIATFQLDQTEQFILGIDTMNEGNITKAKDIFNDILNNEDTNSFLHKDASEQLDEINYLQTTYSETEDAIDNIHQLEDEKQYADALDTIYEAKSND